MVGLLFLVVVEFAPVMGGASDLEVRIEIIWIVM